MRLKSIEEIFNAEDPTYLIEKVFFKNTLNLLVSGSGECKSLLALNIAYSVATGKPLWGHFNVTESGRVLIVDEETGNSFLKKRLKDLSFTIELPIKFLHLEEVKVDDPSSFEELQNHIDTFKPIFVVFDCLVRLHNQKENLSEEMAKVMSKFRTLVNQGYTVLLLHHHRKRGDFYRGSTDILASVDSCFAIQKKGSELTLSCIKNRFAEPFKDIRLSFLTNDSSIEIIYAGYAGNKLQETLDEVIQILQGGKELGVEDIRNALKKHRIGINRLRDLLDEAVRDGVLSRTSTGRNKKLYTINPSRVTVRPIFKWG
jgi:hypothetical protein